jgi:hypothetical protein
MTATLAPHTSDGPCAKCRQIVAKRPGVVTHLLTIGGRSWALCGNHAAQACHAHGIRHATFNPTGKTSA